MAMNQKCLFPIQRCRASDGFILANWEFGSNRRYFYLKNIYIILSIMQQCTVMFVKMVTIKVAIKVTVPLQFCYKSSMSVWRLSVFITWRHTFPWDNHNDDRLIKTIHRLCKSLYYSSAVRSKLKESQVWLWKWEIIKLFVRHWEQKFALALHTADAAKRCTMAFHSICDWVQLSGYEQECHKIQVYWARQLVSDRCSL